MFCLQRHFKLESPPLPPPIGGTDHVLCADSLRVGYGRHLGHADLPVGGGGLRGGALLQGPEADHEEGAVRGQAAGHRVHARWTYRRRTTANADACADTKHCYYGRLNVLCRRRNQNAGGARAERMRHPDTAPGAWRHSVRSTAEGQNSALVYFLYFQLNVKILK